MLGRRATPHARTPRAAAALLLLALASAGCGGGAPAVPPPLSAAAIRAELAKPVPAGATPAQLRLERAWGTLLPGGGDAAEAQFDRTLADLRGRVVVVNLWGDWCPPCRKETPVFQRAALRLRGEAVFLGVASPSSRANTDAFLRRLPLPYPSIDDPKQQVNEAIGGVSTLPKTLFYGPRGGRPFVHLGSYRSVAELVADVRRYAA